MARKRKALQNKDGDAPSLKAGRPSREYSIEDAVKMVTHNKLQLDQALRACCLQGIVSTQTLHYHVQMAKKNAQSNVHEGLLVDVVIGDTCTTTSPLTEDSSQKILQQKPAVVRRRKSSKQACEVRLEAKKQSEEYQCRFKLAFKAGTDALSRRMVSHDSSTSEFDSATNIVARLNQKYELNGGKKA
ncbi:hypothetical protein MHU86_16346 [Fragilaria crotonensis]|nr:hypothetical protein MHU86_16346 [Fragilaria crotonensis]